MVKMKKPIPSANQETLTLDVVAVEDGGRYFCRATNSQGAQEAGINLTVLGLYSWLMWLVYVVGLCSWLCF